jgi:hypothetical protein
MRRKHKPSKHQHVFKKRLPMLSKALALEIKPFMNFRDREYNIHWKSKAAKAKRITLRRTLLGQFLTDIKFTKRSPYMQSKTLKIIMRKDSKSSFTG